MIVLLSLRRGLENFDSISILLFLHLSQQETPKLTGKERTFQRELDEKSHARLFDSAYRKKAVGLAKILAIHEHLPK